MNAMKYIDSQRQAISVEKKEQKKKVVFVLQSLTAGGAERVLITLMNGLDRSRFEPEFIVMNETGPLRDWIAKDVPFHPLGQKRISRGIPKLAAKLNEIAPDIIVSTMAAMNYGVLLTKPFLKKKARIIIREAVTPSSIAEHQKLPWIVKRAYRNLYPQADLVVSPAKCIINEFKTYLGMDISNYMLLHNPVDIQKIRSHQIIQEPISEARKTTPHFVCAGRLHKQKGFDRLIKTMAKIKDKKWKLDILGEGKERENLDTLIKEHGLEEHVTLRGLVKQPWPIIAAADAFLLPSRWEGLPNVALESLSVGTPVIAMYEAGGIQEIADIAQRGAVQVVNTMDHMLHCIEYVRPRPTRTMRDSLLPEYFHLENVTSRFSDLLHDDAHKPHVATTDHAHHNATPAQTAITEQNQRKFGRRRKAA